MHQRHMRSLPVAALLVASVHGQDNTITSTIPVCPTAASTTITLPTTVTFCPGPHCNGGSPQMTPPPMNGVGMPGVNVGQYTSVGPDGKTTVLGIWETVYDSLCETGLVPATWTITQECPCEATPHPTALPSGFETTVVPCSVCAHPTVTLTQPCPTGPYATQTPSTGQPAAAPGAGSGMPAGSGAMASAGASAGANAIAGSGPAPMASAGSSSGASAQSGPGAASAQAGSGASAQAGPMGASAGAGAAASAQAGSGSMVPNPMAPSPMAPDTMPAPAPTPAPASGNMTNMPVGNGTRQGTAPVSTFMSSAGQATFAGFTLVVGIVAALIL